MRYPAIAPVLMLVLATAACDEGPTEPQTEDEECTIPEGMMIHPPELPGDLPCQGP